MAKKNLVHLVEEAFDKFQLEYELVDVEFLKENNQWILRVIIDEPEGIQHADCEKVSRILGDYLDEKDPIERSYNLEVSSPGIERPLKKAADYERFTGREARVFTYAAVKGKKKFDGIIAAVKGDEVHLEVDGEEMILPMDKISKAHLLFRFESL
jgi:ribosome maturation factor RimP